MSPARDYQLFPGLCTESAVRKIYVETSHVRPNFANKIHSSLANQPRCCMSDPWERTGVVETYTGGGFDLFAPDPADVALEDTAARLAHTCRFGGHCREFYSVAHHSLHVSAELFDASACLRLLGLLHDASEAYLGDIPRPLKAAHDVFERIESDILDAVWASFDGGSQTDDEWDRIMAADDRLLAYEVSYLLKGGDWAGDPPDRMYELQSDDIQWVRDKFASRTRSLLNQL
ncbi:MAG: hypothetical protein J07HQX50_01605 [Haloquadratum sp. J07HQX50]|nr:MAG: hypothetical protein J07HQX50_01605 [Haloquadratum sp. J07HQX50]